MRRYVPYPTTHCEVCLLERYTRVELLRHLVRRSPKCGANLMMRYKPANLRITRQWDQDAVDDPARIKGKAKLPPAFRYPGPVLPIVGIQHEPTLYRNVLGGRGHKHYAL